MEVQSSPGGSLAYRDRLSDSADRWIYFSIWIIGTVGIIGLKILHFRQLYVTAFPVILMLGYIAYLWFAPRERLRDDRAGDSVYYLGFLYTMASLAYSLMEFGDPSGKGTDTGAIIVNFGVALSTTIVGMAGRVVFHQMRENPLEIEREARVEIAATVSRLRTELLGAIEDFGTLRRAAIQNTSDTLEEVTKKTYEKLSESANRHEQLATDLLAVLRDTAEILKRDTALTNRAAKRTLDALDRLTERLDKSELPADVLKTKFLELASSFSELASHELKRAEAHKQSIENLAESVSVLQNTTSLVNGQITDLIQAIRDERTAIQAGITEVASATGAVREGIAAVVTTSRAAVNDQSKILQELAANSADQLASVQRHRKSLEEELVASRAATAAVHTSLTSLASIVAKNVNGL